MGFAERFPRWITGILGVVQLAITAAIIGLELRSAYIDLAHGTIWAGLWCVLSGALACVIIYFDQVFINDLCKCYLGDQICCALRGIPSLQSNYSAILDECALAITHNNSASLVCPSVPYDKLGLIKAQLGCAVGMLITCGIYVMLFLFACFGICFGHD
ncbi:unnamed protein product [Adineta steineri]|uniref:Uncharacterized protein n=1 Tax=Adineta steineri TaxID=433720 RepID=A0A815LPV8_9BILA|nr:unnamed protein product [Adineta steineri]CAF1618190.1 unnamed protein product [Adineta steineri]